MHNEHFHADRPTDTEELVVGMHVLNLMERGHTILPDATQPRGELLLTTCDMETIRRCVREHLQTLPQDTLRR